MDNLTELMGKFCDIVMPGHGKKKGYINVKERVKELGKDRRTYYNWKNGESFPRLPDFVKKLNEKGYKVTIELKEDFYK